MAKKSYKTSKPITDSSSEFITLNKANPQISIGETLKKRRQNLNISINEVSSFLHVKKSDIEAIENNEMTRIAKHLYLSGLIRSYGKFLKIDEQTFEEEIKLLKTGSNAKDKKYKLIKFDENIDLTPSKDSFFSSLIISTLLFLIIVLIYNHQVNKDKLITNQSIIFELQNFDQNG